MKNLKFLNNKYIIFFFLLFNFAFAEEEAIDIWNLENNNKENQSLEIENKTEQLIEKSIINVGENNNIEFEILKDNELKTDKINLVGLYDPEENELKIDMWSKTDGKNIKSLFAKIEKLKLSKDAKKILDIALLTNSYFPEKNITPEEFLKFKSNYLIKNNDFDLIKKYLGNNRSISSNSILVKHFVEKYLSESDLKKTCEIFDVVDFVEDDYLSKYKIYCLINKGQKEEAQLILDLKKELGFKDSFFDKKFNFLMGYDSSQNKEISEKNILDFHLSHRTNTEFSFSPNQNTKKIIWKYLSSSNLLEKVDLIDLEDIERIKIIEKATNEGNYTEKDLFNLYKRFQFSINQLLTVKDTYKILPSFEGRALLYQRLILTIDNEEKLDLSLKLKESFLNDEIGNAFNIELSEILKQIKIEEVPSNYTKFYETNLITKKPKLLKIKFNNKILHQSKLLNYFIKKTEISKVEKEVNEALKKIKKNDKKKGKKYFFSTKDYILLESLKSDGIKISNKYKNTYKTKTYNIPYDIQLLIKNNETGMVLLRIAEIIGEDDLIDLDQETLYFIIGILNELKIITLRNDIILKILPLKE